MSLNSWTENYGDEMFMDFNMTELSMDQAYLRVKNNHDIMVYIYDLVKECIRCPFKIFNTANSHSETAYKVNTGHHTLYRFQVTNNQSNQSIICELDPNFGQFGVYEVEVNGTGCQLEVLKEPVNIYFPMLTVFLIYCVLFLIPIFFTLRKIYFRRKSKLNVNSATAEEKPGKNVRLKSLDTFRGICIIVMVFVNYGAGNYLILEHAIWNGLQIADVVFPWFMWIMGVCIPISVTSTLKRDVPIRNALWTILRRSCILFALGVFTGSSTNLNRLRIFGVLQRFGICYFIVATMCLFMMKKADGRTDENPGKLMNFFKDILRIKYMWIITLLILTAHCLIIFLLPVPDCPTGYLGPGGMHENYKYQGCTGGATGYIDRLILGNHVYRYPTIVDIYESQVYDPEGILGCLTSIVQVFIGVQAGITLLTFKDHTNRLSRWICWGIVTGIIGGGLCDFSKEDGVIPVNKNLWSISFVLVTSCFAFLLLSTCYVLIDVKKFWSGKPFLYAGMNAIIIYVGHIMTFNNFPIRWHLENSQTHFLALIQNVWSTMMWVFIAAYLYYKKCFLSI